MARTDTWATGRATYEPGARLYVQAYYYGSGWATIASAPLATTGATTIPFTRLSHGGWTLRLLRVNSRAYPGAQVSPSWTVRIR